MNKKEKILACVGNIKSSSIPKVVGCSPSYVTEILYRIGHKDPIKNHSSKIFDYE